MWNASVISSCVIIGWDVQTQFEERGYLKLKIYATVKKTIAETLKVISPSLISEVKWSEVTLHFTHERERDNSHNSRNTESYLSLSHNTTLKSHL